MATFARPTTCTIRYQAVRYPRRAFFRRCISTVPPPQRSRSWQSSVLRWGLALGGIYYYNTSPLFADAPSLSPSYNPPASGQESSAPTLESIAAERRQRQHPPQPGTSSEASPKTIKASSREALQLASGDQGTLQSAEEGAEQQGAYNEETGEINWDCACLGGMAHGPCGEQFKEAFSCFVYSKEEPKGMDCIDHFKSMQTCFREHPDHYGDELSGDDEADEEESPAIRAPKIDDEGPTPAASTPPHRSAISSGHIESPEGGEFPEGKRAKATSPGLAIKHPEPQAESDELVPKARHDTTEKNRSFSQQERS